MLAGWLQPPERLASIINAAGERKAETSLAAEPAIDAHARSEQGHFRSLLNGLIRVSWSWRELRADPARRSRLCFSHDGAELAMV
jgi:hypothetical protein